MNRKQDPVGQQDPLPGLIDIARLPSLMPTVRAAPEQVAGDSCDEAAVEAILDGLNAEQKQAVVHQNTPLLIVAGAGSGKTRVLTRRIAYLLATGQARPSGIMAITFTNKAAAEMRSRVEELVGSAAQWMWVSTFHSACVKILRREASTLGLKSNFSIYDAQDSSRLISMICSEQSLDPKKFSARMLANRISRLKNQLIDPDAFHSEVEHTNQFDRTLAQVYQIYQDRLQTAHALDFDDLIMQTVSLLEAFPQVAEHYRQRFSHILVDEYQDTNHAQYLLIRALAGVVADGLVEDQIEPAQLTVVGDQDQSIYAFRGATLRNITQFALDYPQATTILLEQNYRSTGNILGAANAIIAGNKDRAPKNLWTAEGDGPKVVGYVAESEHEEAQFIAREIDRLGDDAGVLPGDVAIFYRTNAQSRVLEETFIRVGLPYRVVGATRFYERKEIRDALAYLRAAANLDDTVSVRRIFNTPKRGLGDQAEALVQGYSTSQRISFGAALQQGSEINGLTPRALLAVTALSELLSTMNEMSEGGTGPAKILDYAMNQSGYLAILQESKDPQDASRVENLAEFHAVASEFEASQPDGNLADFLERVALVADVDQLGADEPEVVGQRPTGQVTLMTVHTAKGLEFPVVFVTGFEDGTFPHQRSMASESELAEERRLAYVALTRARQRLYISRAEMRTTWGMRQQYIPSRFLRAIPQELIEWRGSPALPSRSSLASAAHNLVPQATKKPSDLGLTKIKPKPVSEIPKLKAGDKVTHVTYGDGVVTEVSGVVDNPVAAIDFARVGNKRILLRYASITKQ
ncbi:MAG: DNA helicase PcrA [Micrococcales bacterium]|nr:DNA helicase PcrA [Micrococcales bacterium]